MLNAHSYYSLRYGTFSIHELADAAVAHGYDALALTDINNSTGVLDFVKACFERGIKPVAGMEFRENDRLLYIALARNNQGFSEINELLTEHNLSGKALPRRPDFSHTYVIYPYGSTERKTLRDHEYIGIRPGEISKILFDLNRDKYIMLHAVAHKSGKDFEVHKKLRAVDKIMLLSQLEASDMAGPGDYFMSVDELLATYERVPELIVNTRRLIDDCSFEFDFKTIKNKKHFTGSAYEDKLLLEKLACDGMQERYGKHHAEAEKRVRKELEIIEQLGFSSYFLITWDIVRYSMQKGYYHVGRGSGANSVVAYCLRITDVCPIELNLYFERFLNPKRTNPPDIDIDYSWKDRDDVLRYIFDRYGKKHTALLGAMSTFQDRAIIRELGKVHGLPKDDIDRLIRDPQSELNKSELCKEVLQYFKAIENFPNVRSIHAGGVLISEEPLSHYCALDLPPKGLPTIQFDMHVAEDIGFEKLDVLSQRGIGHIKDATILIKQNQGIDVDFRDVETFKKDAKTRELLKSANTIGSFYIESPAMRGLLSKLQCDNYITLVAASSIIRPGVAKSGMMKEYIYRHHHQDSYDVIHPVMKEHLSETYGVMVYQEDVIKVGHYFGGLDLADADALRRMMSGKYRHMQQLEEISKKFYAHCDAMNYPRAISEKVWMQMESFAGFSFNKAHSASYAVESYQSLYLKAHFPLEFMVAVVNNFGGFYRTRVYINELRKAGGHVHLPCVNHSTYLTTLYGRDVYLGFVHVKSLEQQVSETLLEERRKNGPYLGLEDFILRTGISLEQLRILIRVNAFDFTGKNKPSLLWEAHLVYNKDRIREASTVTMFEPEKIDWQLPEVSISQIEQAYDEMELLEFLVSCSEFDLLKTSFRGQCKTRELMQYVGQTVKMVGAYVTEKTLRTSHGERMAFGTFIDDEDQYFDTVHFPKSLREYPFKGKGVYLILAKVTEEFGFPSLIVEKMAPLPVKGDKRYE
ncbi:MAG: DNA polymerase III subunit alpha [Bacteroidetes bacterium]|nr:DNA polymerase III subunit alpha [Bacteroidota bacterium]